MISFGREHPRQPIEDDGTFWCPPECAHLAERAGHIPLNRDTDEGEEDAHTSSPHSPRDVDDLSRNEAWNRIKEIDTDDTLGLSYRDSTGEEMRQALHDYYSTDDAP